MAVRTTGTEYYYDFKNEEKGMNPPQPGDMEDPKWMWIQELVTVLLYYEILTRRQRRESNNRRFF